MLGCSVSTAFNSFLPDTERRVLHRAPQEGGLSTHSCLILASTLRGADQEGMALSTHSCLIRASLTSTYRGTLYSFNSFLPDTADSHGGRDDAGVHLSTHSCLIPLESRFTRVPISLTFNSFLPDTPPALPREARTGDPFNSFLPDTACGHRSYTEEELSFQLILA